MSVVAIVLAAGSSSRMGQPKQVLPLAGKSLVRWAAEAATGSQAATTIVVTGGAAEAVAAELAGLPVRIVHNPDYQQGMSTSLRAGLHAVPDDAQGIVVMLADQPFVSASVVDGLIALYEQSHPPIVRPRYGGQPGNPVLWDRSLVAELMAQTGDQGGRSLLQQHRSEIIWLDLPDERVQTDIDTPEAYARLSADRPSPPDPLSRKQARVSDVDTPAPEPPPHPHDNVVRYCQRCATPLQMLPVTFDNNRIHPRCPSCGFVVWSDPKVAVLAVMPWEGGILLGKRTEHPGIGKWSFPSGFVDRGEPLEDALLREILEETGLTAEILGLIGVYSERGNPTVVIAYAVEAQGGTLVGNDDLVDLRAFLADGLPEMAFEHDTRIVQDWLALRQRMARDGGTQPGQTP
jgi:molybdenum cofactor cytidylyltransferase